ncbi:MAG: ABC transporter ATP-binding protein, partial [Cyclobacteriaceae bacterium]
ARYRDNVKGSRINEVLEIVKLAHTKDKKAKAFSMGMKQRLGIAIALLSKPELLILDEPTNGLDPKGIQEIRSLITDLNKKHNTTIFISSHLLSEIEKLCSHVGIIKDGSLIFQDTVSNLKFSQKGLSIELETDDVPMLNKVLNEMKITHNVVNEKIVSLAIDNKSEILTIIDKLRTRQIAIYQVKTKNNLEDLFLKLTENE